VEQGQEAARVALLNVLAAVRSVTGSLDAVRRIVKLNGWVASAEGFTSQPLVVNGASALLEEIFGEAGKHARAAIGVAELPLGAPVELELIVEVQPE
jgi:enamine deaminase RidA (YjgF/YER057c/UK114 family)